MSRLIENIVVVVAVLIAIAIGFGIYAWSGAYNIGADAHHTRPVFALMTLVRDRSLNAHAAGIKVPNLDDRQLILKGAGQYAAMCTQCHLRPGVENSEQREGMYPLPPNLSQARFTPQREFWAIKHGIKMSGMPAWGVNHDDPTIWSMVAFLQKLPDMTPAQYKAIVAIAPPDEDMDRGSDHAHCRSDAPHAHPATSGVNMLGMAIPSTASSAPAPASSAR
ncbi:MAG TPA: cytochrome c [Rhodanobacteraceae bacterium]